MMLEVQLRYAPLPFIGRFAWHYWFVVSDETGAHHWEVWQTKNAGGTCIGHVHCDLTRVAFQWSGEDAQRIARVLERAGSYPSCERYRLWPGPNSNTFVAWVLREAGIDFALDARGIGRSYLTAKQ